MLCERMVPEGLSGEVTMKASNKQTATGVQALVVNDRIVEDCGKCECCGRTLKKPRRCHQKRRGPRVRFCNDTCRKRAARDRNSRTTPLPPVKASGKSQKIPKQSGGSDPENRGVAVFTVPLNLLGGFKFENAEKLEPALVAAIKRTESRLVEIEVVKLPVVQKDTPVRRSDWEPSPNCDPNAVPEIPPFLQRNPDNSLRYPGLLADDSESEEAAA
jgi:hypothetical protein